MQIDRQIKALVNQLKTGKAKNIYAIENKIAALKLKSKVQKKRKSTFEWLAS